MATLRLVQIVFVNLAFATLISCSTKPAVCDTTPKHIFKQPIEIIYKSAIDALFVNGFDITKQEQTYVEGYRPVKRGLFASSGGETVGIWMVKQGPNMTEVMIDTAKSLGGQIGQKNWDADILREMTNTLN